MEVNREIEIRISIQDIRKLIFGEYISMDGFKLCPDFDLHYRNLKDLVENMAEYYEDDE